MIQFFGISVDTLTNFLLVVTSVIVGIVLLLALCNAIFFKIGVRNISRRRMQMGLIIFALMLSTTLLSSVLATGDVMTTTVQSVAVYNWGNIDELIEGGHGPLGLYPQNVYTRLLANTRSNTDITTVGAALRENDLLVADQTSRQVRSHVAALAVVPGSEQGFGGMQDITTSHHLAIADLHPGEVYLNQTAAQLLNAHVGDTLYLYSQRWPGRRYSMHVNAIVNNAGLVGDNPYMLSLAQTFQDIEQSPQSINEIYVANRGGGGVNGLSLSASVADELQDVLPRDVHAIQVKQQGVQTSQKAQDIFSRIFSLFSLFSLAIGLLLIFLIFVLLAAERRAEMGMARAIGVQRRHLVWMFLFEGAVYDLLSSSLGLLLGLGLGALFTVLLQPELQRFNFPLKFSLQPHSMIIAYCLGIIFTFVSIALSSWLVSRMTVAEALRDLPEPGRSDVSLGELGLRGLQLGQQFVLTLVSPRAYPTLRTRVRSGRRLLFEHIPNLLLQLIRMLVALGFLPMLAGCLLMQYGLENTLIIPFSLGLSLLVLGAGLLLKAISIQFVELVVRARNQKNVRRRAWHGVAHSILAALVGLALVAYWALPFDVLAQLGLPRFQGGIEIFFIAGVMMVLGAVWAIIANAQLLVLPFLALSARLPGLYTLIKLASSYPLQRRFRTALNVVMFSLVVFAMTVMTTITTSMQNTYVDINTQTGGYDIQGTAYFKSLPDLQTALAQNGVNPASFSAIGVRSTTAVGVIQLSAAQPRWTYYPAQVVSGGFLRGYGLHLSARASGFTSDSAVWNALQSNANYALIDSSSLPYNPNAVTNVGVYDPTVAQPADASVPATPPGLDARTTFAMSGVYQGDTVFPATPVWIAGIEGRKAQKLTIIGVVDNSDSAHFGLYIPRSALSDASIGAGVPASTPEAQSYYFKVAPGQDKRTLALALGSAFLDYGLETTVLEDAIWQTRGPRILLSNVLLGVVGLTLLFGIAALAITGTRAVIERRQQIGMLRAVGCSRALVRAAFLLESFVVGLLGSVLGIVLGLVLARNIFAANFFEQYQTGLTFSIPWQQLGLIVGVSVLASLLGAVLPAWLAGNVTPIEALRYE